MSSEKKVETCFEWATGNDYDVFSIKTCKPDKITVGHLPREISRPTKFWLDRGAEIVAEMESSHYRRSPLIQGGLEIRCKVSVTLPGTIKNHMLLDRYKKLVNKLIIWNFLTFFNITENIHLNQPQQQQLAQKEAGSFIPLCIIVTICLSYF